MKPELRAVIRDLEEQGVEASLRAKAFSKPATAASFSSRLHTQSWPSFRTANKSRSPTSSCTTRRSSTRRRRIPTSS